MFEITIASQPIPLKHFQNTTFVQFITIFSKLGFQLHFIPVQVKYKVPVPIFLTADENDSVSAPMRSTGFRFHV